MVSMKLSKKEAGEYTGATPADPGDGPAYPYGLCIYLDTETLAKLGYTEPPAVGSELKLVANVTVTSTGVDQQQDGDKRSRCDLQITDMELHSPGPDAAAMYSKSKMNP